MGEYEDRYPDAYGHGEAVEPESKWRHFRGLGLPRQVRGEALVGERAADPPAEPAPPSRIEPRVEPRPRQTVVRTPREICDEVWERLTENQFIDATHVEVSVHDSEVTLDGTINSLIAVSMAQALAEGAAGVSRVHLHLKVQPAPRGWEMVPDDR